MVSVILKIIVLTPDEAITFECLRLVLPIKINFVQIWHMDIQIINNTLPGMLDRCTIMKVRNDSEVGG